MNIAELPTPALLLDAVAFEANVSRMATTVSRAGKRLRPHAKAHKCVRVAQHQVKAGAAGVCVATVAEAELMAGAGIPEILLTSPVADPRKCARMIEVAASTNLTVVVDHEEQTRMYGEGAARTGLPLKVLVDLDLGDHRTGISPGEPALKLAQEIARCPNLLFGGLQAYSVRASHMSETEDRAAYYASVMDQALRTKTLLATHGLPVPVVTGGSSGTCSADTALPFVTELQAGSYVFMDVAYARIGGVEFQQALTVLATVVSANAPDRVTVDAGFKAFATDRPFGPEVLNVNGASYQWAGDEFGYVFLDRTKHRISIGDRLRFIPPHCDPTVNLYDRIHVCRGEEVEDVWPVS